MTALLVAMSLLLCSCTTVSSDSSDWQNGNTDDTTPIFTSYSDFVDVKSERFGSFTRKVYSSKDLVLSAGPKLLSVSAIDIQFLPLSLLSNAEKADGSFSGNSKGYLNTVVTVKEDGVFDIEYDTYTGDKRESIYGSYNADNGYMSCKKTVDGIVTVSLEYMPVENGYLSQYRDYVTGEIIRIGFDNDKFCIAIYDGSEYTELNKIAKEAFIEGAEINIVEANGELKATIEDETIYA